MQTCIRNASGTFHVFRPTIQQVGRVANLARDYLIWSGVPQGYLIVVFPPKTSN